MKPTCHVDMRLCQHGHEKPSSTAQRGIQNKSPQSSTGSSCKGGSSWKRLQRSSSTGSSTSRKRRLYLQTSRLPKHAKAIIPKDAVWHRQSRSVPWQSSGRSSTSAVTSCRWRTGPGLTVKPVITAKPEADYHNNLASFRKRFQSKEEGQVQGPATACHKIHRQRADRTSIHGQGAPSCLRQGCKALAATSRGVSKHPGKRRRKQAPLPSCAEYGNGLHMMLTLASPVGLPRPWSTTAFAESTFAGTRRKPPGMRRGAVMPNRLHAHNDQDVACTWVDSELAPPPITHLLQYRIVAAMVTIGGNRWTGARAQSG